jgi:hypothetical protein
MMYFILIRQISPYTAPDILLGAFDSEHAAQDARNSYLDRYHPTDQKLTSNSWFTQIFSWLRGQPDTNPNGDPWHIQGYRTTGLTEDDLIIQSFNIQGDPAFNEISVVSCYYDDLGQITREIDSIHPNRLVAEQRMKEIETTTENTTPYEYLLPSKFDTQTIKINEIQSDDPEQQRVR